MPSHFTPPSPNSIQTTIPFLSPPLLSSPSILPSFRTQLTLNQAAGGTPGPGGGGGIGGSGPRGPSGLDIFMCIVLFPFVFSLLSCFFSPFFCLCNSSI